MVCAIVRSMQTLWHNACVGISVQFVMSPTVMSISCVRLIMSVVLVYSGAVSIKSALLATQPQPCIWSMVSYLMSFLRAQALV